jgi:hypothetical protein
LGSTGAIVFDASTRQPMLLGSQHVLFEPRSDGRVWQPAPCGIAACECNVVARLSRWRRSIVAWREGWYYIDAAVAGLESGVEWVATAPGVASAEKGMTVRKAGAATGSTCGWIFDEHHVERIRFGSFELEVPNQLRIQPFSPNLRFAAEGDSGALVCDEKGRAVALLWGVDDWGQGIACPIGPVMQELEIEFAEVVQ